jgi:hypothetical protein
MFSIITVDVYNMASVLCSWCQVCQLSVIDFRISLGYDDVKFTRMKGLTLLET